MRAKPAVVLSFSCLLSFGRDVLAGFRRHLQEQRGRAAGGVVGSGGGHSVLGRNADHLGDDATDFAPYSYRSQWQRAASGTRRPRRGCHRDRRDYSRSRAGVFKDGDQSCRGDLKISRR